MRRALMLTAAVAALVVGSVAGAQPPPPGSGVGTAQNRNGQQPQSLEETLAGDVAARRLSQAQADDLAAQGRAVRETAERQGREAGRRIRGSLEANRLEIEQNGIDMRSGSGQAAVNLADTGLRTGGQAIGEADIVTQDLLRGTNAIIQRRAAMIAENPNVPEAERRRVTREAEQVNHNISRVGDALSQAQFSIDRTRRAISENRDRIATRADDMIARYGPDPRNWPGYREPGSPPPPPASPAPPPPWSVTPPSPPSPPAPPSSPSTPSGPPRRGTIPTTAAQDPAFRARPVQTPTSNPTPGGTTGGQAQQPGQQGGGQSSRPPPPAPPRRTPPPPPPPAFPPPLNRPPTVLAPVYGPPVPNSHIPRARPANPNQLGLPDPNPRSGGGGGSRGPFEFRPVPGNALVEGEFDWMGDAAGGGPWGPGDSLAWAEFLRNAALRPPGGNESWRGFERGMPMTVAELEAIYEGWDINTAPPGSSGRSLSSAGNSPRMDWYLPPAGATAEELAFWQAAGLLFRNATEGGPWIEWGELDLANVAVRVNGNGQPMPGSLAQFLRDNYYVNFPAFWDGALNFDMWQYDPIADRDRELARLLYGPLWSDRPYRLTFDPTGRNNRFSPDSELAGFLSDLSFDDLFDYLLRGGIGGLDRLLAQPFNVLLTWGAGAFDVDLHMTGPTGLPDNSRFHIFYAATGALDRPPFAQLVRDCICRSGSEVILTTTLLQGGVYRISAFNFGNQSTTSTELSTNADLRLLIVRGGAAVSVGNGTTIQGGTVVFAGAPTAGRPGNTWVGVEIDPRTGQIRFVNRSDNSVNGDGTGTVVRANSLPPTVQSPAIAMPGARQGGPEQ